MSKEETEKVVSLTSEATVKGQDSFTMTSDWTEGLIFKGYCTFSIDYFGCMLCLDSWNIQLISSHRDLWLHQLIQWLQHLYFVTEKLRCLERKQRINWLGFLAWWNISFFFFLLNLFFLSHKLKTSQSYGCLNFCVDVMSEMLLKCIKLIEVN